jgi:hypothetical protein
MLHTLEFRGNPPLIPTVVVPCYRASLAPGLSDQLVRVVKKEQQHILDTTPEPTYGGNFLSGRFQHYNLFYYNHEELRSLESFIRQEYTNYMTSIDHPVESCYIRGWANMYPGSSNLVWHNHFEALFGVEGPAWTHVSGNLCIQTFGTRTWYLSPFLGGVGHNDFGDDYNYPADVLGIDNHDGECFFFPSWLVHKTEKNANPTQPRMTIAFDIIPESVYLRKKDNSLFKRLI